jgi:pimeloyl-ACP methyl ester carboxylesterase
MHAFSRAWEAQPLFATQTRLPLGTREVQRDIRRAHSADGLAHALRTLGLGQMPDYRGVLQSHAIPVELVVGELDDKFVVLANELSCNASRLQLELVPRAGHNVLLEAPNALARVLTRAFHP